MTVQDVDNAFRKKAESNVKLYAIRKKIEAGTATMADMAEYSNIICKLLGKTLGENLEKIPESERAKFCEWLLRNQYEDANERLAAVQQFLDQKQNIHIKPQKPKFPAERAKQAAHSLEDQTVSQEVIQRRAEQAIANIANSFHDDYIQENAKFRSNAGLKCHVTRIGANKCCAWCAEVAGRYLVGSEPADFWRRHDNCTCRIDYENQKVRQRLVGAGNGKERKWVVDSEVQRRIAQSIQYKPARFTPEQARETERQNLQYKGLTIPGKTGIMETVRYFGNGSNIGENGNPVISLSGKEKPSYYPSEIAGTKRGNAMSFEEANHMKANPNFRKIKECRSNCQTCVVAFEARLRGYNVEAKPNFPHSMSFVVSGQTNLPWIDPKTGKNPEYIYDKNAGTPTEFLKFMEKTVQQGERYTIEFARKLKEPHIISLNRTETGELRLYDPQSGKSFTGKSLERYLKKIKYYHRDGDEFNSRYTSPQLLRVDNAYFDLSIVNELLKGKGT